MAAVDARSSGARSKVYFHLSQEVYSGDLIFAQGRPLLVVSWRTIDGKRLPYVSFPLDAAVRQPYADHLALRRRVLRPRRHTARLAG